MNKEYIPLSELSKEIYHDKISKTQPIDESTKKSLRNKYNFLMNRVVMRSKLDWRCREKDMIPLKDKSIVKALLIKSYFPQGKDDVDHIFVDWFNDSIDESDYDKIIELGNRAESLIKYEVSYDDWDLDDVTIDEWVAAIHSSINFTRALSIKKFAYEMKNLYDNSNVLNHDMPFGDMIKENEYGKRSYIWKGLRPNIDTSLPLNEVLSGCFSQEDYANLVLQLMLVIIQDCQNKTVDFIKAYAELKKNSGCVCADELLETGSLASEYVKFFQNIYDYLYDRPELTKEIENEIGTDDLLTFFKMKDRNAKNPKKTKNE
ncbi:hypothetical protein [Ruminococcus flavefaciens]|uniref:hypothetical protein n=1 Tax=Ruminococcus flavefaciens TaxID=1265 RepID=UPI00048D5E9F|nr:hypothetical protein [Ruminococcus flavefaciens]